ARGQFGGALPSAVHDHQATFAPGGQGCRIGQGTHRGTGQLHNPRHRSPSRPVGRRGTRGLTSTPKTVSSPPSLCPKHPEWYFAEDVGTALPKRLIERQHTLSALMLSDGRKNAD